MPKLSPTPSVQEVTPPPLHVRIHHPPRGGPYPPISPGTAETVLRMEDEELTDTARAVSFGLCTTIRRRTAIAQQHLAESRANVNRLQGIVDQREAEIRRLRNRARNVEMPGTFERNNGRVNAQIPDQAGNLILATWIRIMGNGEVLARAGEHGDEPEYVVSLYLDPDYSRDPTAPMGQWFQALLQSNGGAYHTMAEAARHLDNPAAYA